MTGEVELQPDDGPRLSLGIGPGSDDAVRSRRSSLGDPPKGSGSSLGTHREITERRPEDSLQECRRLSNWWDERRVYRHRPGFHVADSH
ncbi:hypothetical protein B296_00004059 [Ensete ventricosum]|uniref:Uncharacterized protein n=1 Tax=Ensete ventricosum TaxID=4639 RepID=A0A426ZSQ4_ENSVE|nr:hypothetical protein B296_00004059 [Ensete ventricosum]